MILPFRIQSPVQWWHSEAQRGRDLWVHKGPIFSLGQTQGIPLVPAVFDMNSFFFKCTRLTRLQRIAISSGQDISWFLCFLVPFTWWDQNVFVPCYRESRWRIRETVAGHLTSPGVRPGTAKPKLLATHDGGQADPWDIGQGGKTWPMWIHIIGIQKNPFINPTWENTIVCLLKILWYHIHKMYMIYIYIYYIICNYT